MKLSDVAPHDPDINPDQLKIGVSACLLGSEVRYDGGHKRDRFLTDVLSTFVHFVTVCPEVEFGMGIPRETIRLEMDGDDTRLVAPASGTDHTENMRAFVNQRVEDLVQEELCGFVLKKDSPSCGLFRVKRYAKQGMPKKDGRGFFAEALARRFPLLPMEEDGRLNDPVLRESFIERAFAYRRLKNVFQDGWKPSELIEFHTREKMLILAHDPQSYRRLGRLIGEISRHDRDALEAAYQEGFMKALSTHASVGRHTNVLQHMAGYFREHLDKRAREELAAHIMDYSRGVVPILVPLALIRHWVSAFSVEWLAKQSYLEPQPKELMLRTHVSGSPQPRSSA